MQFMSNPKAAAESDLGYYGPYDPSSVLGKALNTAIGVIDPTPFGAFGGLLSGTTTVDPYGKTVLKPVGMLGKVSEFMIEKHYEVAGQIKNKTPGYHQFYSGGQLVSIVPQTIFGKQIGYTTLGPGDLPADVAIKQYAAMMGYDPNTVDLSKAPGQKGFGVELEAFVPGTGGFTQQGSFVNVAGDEVSQLSSADLESQLGLVADIYGIDTAMKALSTAKISDQVRSSLTDALSAGQLTAKAITDNKGNVVGYDTGIGSVVTSASGIVTSGSGAPVTSGYGIMSTEMYDSLKMTRQEEDRVEGRTEADATLEDVLGFDPGLDWSGGEGAGPTTVEQTPTKMTSQEEDRVEGRTEADATLEDVLGFDPGLDWSGGEGAGPTTVEQTPTTYSPVMDSESDNNDRDSDPTGASDGFGSGGSYGFAKGGFAQRQPMQEGGQAPAVGEAGFIGGQPENIPNGDTVADDVPVDVPEGTFVINAAAVEFAGSEDIKKMLLDAMTEAEKQGIDIKQQNATIPKEELVSLVVSKGEVIVPPQLAQVIGYDLLNKINNRGKAEVERRSQEKEQMQSSAPQPPVLAKAGGFIAMQDGGEVNPEQSIIDYHYNTIQQNKVGRDKEGRPITVYSTSVYIPEGKNKGKFALVPGYVDGSTDYSEDQLYQIWKEEIESGKWPVDSSGEESGKRAQRIHQVMDRDADTMPELKRETPSQ
jgi:hypothetical protein